jgi:NarL family two-component system response regulator LiaR
MTGSPIKVLCVDDSPDIGSLLQFAINRQADLTCVGCLPSCDELLLHVQRESPDVVVIDLTMPGKDPIVVMREMSKLWPQTRAVAYSGFDDPELVDRVVDAGAWGFVSKHEGVDRILEAVRRVARGEMAVLKW